MLLEYFIFVKLMASLLIRFSEKNQKAIDILRTGCLKLKSLVSCRENITRCILNYWYIRLVILFNVILLFRSLYKCFLTSNICVKHSYCTERLLFYCYNLTLSLGIVKKYHWNFFYLFMYSSAAKLLLRNIPLKFFRA